MPFLVPATVAFLSDVTVLVLHFTEPSNQLHIVLQRDRWIYHADYAWISAMVRLFLLAVPLYFHSYTGTAVHMVQLYRFFYYGSILFLGIHMLALAMVNPESMESIFGFVTSPTNSHFLRNLWWMLVLSLASTLCHTVVLQHVRSTGPQGPVPTMYFAVRTANQLWNQPNHNFTTPTMMSAEQPPAYIHAMNEFVIDMQARLQRARSEWTSRVEDVTKKVTPPLHAILRLFAHDQLALEQLSRVFEHDNGESLIFYIPQLISFLLHGALYSSPVLEEWILDQCGRNVYFAHRCYWFLRAWCLEWSLLRTNETIVTDRKETLSFQNCQPKQHDGKFYPEERAMIERLMMRVKDRGLNAANAEWDALIMEPAAASPATMVEEAQLGHIPVDPASGCPSVRHFDAIMNYRNKCITAFPNATETAFDQTPRFLDALVVLAESLFLVPRQERKDTLRQQLWALECELLPSNSVYLPVGNRRQHQVWRIAAEESIPISTKERVPCIIYLEVIDSMFRHRQAAVFQHPSWADSLLRTASHNNHAAATTALDLNLSASEDSYDDEGQVLWDWRFGPRNPLRRVSLLDKVTTTVKVPLDKMKTKLRDHLMLSSSSNHKTDEELQSLAEEFLGPESFPASRAEQGLAPLPPEEEVVSGSTIARTSSTGSLVSLGQWSVPAIVPPAKATRSYSSDRARTDSMDASNGKTQSNVMYYGSNDADAQANEQLKPAGECTQEETPSRPPPVVFRESWATKQERVRQKSAFGDHPGWRLLPVLIKANDDLRQEQLAGQLIQRMAMILARERVNVWLCPYDILALTDRAGIIEAIPDTISLDSLKKNSPNYTNLLEFFYSHYGEATEELAGAKANFVESLAAYSIVCFLLQIKDRHNGNILLDKWGHVVHIDFGFFFLSSPGKNVGFESAPFKLTREFVEVLEGPESHLFRTFRDLCCKTFLALRRNCMEIILVVEMLKDGNENLQCFRGHPAIAIQQLRDRFRLDLNDRACKEYVNSLIDDSIENWRTDWYDRYQRYFVGVL